MTSYPRPYPPIPTPGTSSFQPTGPTLRGETTMPDNKTRTVVTVYRPVGDGPPVRYEATNYDVGKQGELDVIDGSRTVATWSQNAWTRAEFAEEIPDFELREGEPVAEPGTFEVYPGPDGNYRFNLRAADGERLAYSQGYALRQSALNAIAEVQQAAAGALIEDVDQ